MEKEFIKSLQHNTEPTETQIKRKQGRKRQKEHYNEKFLIKKVKTRCFKIYLHLLLNCVAFINKEKLNLKKKDKREIFKIFKSDVCKSRNRDILGTPMRHLLNLFSNINPAPIELNAERIHTFEYLMNLSWEDFLIHVKRRTSEFFKEEIDPMVLLTEITEYLKYIKHDTKYKARTIDVNYLNLYKLLIKENKSIISEDEVTCFITNFNELI
jgi:hypothetical protein